MLQDIFVRLPKPTALLILSSLFRATSAHIPRQTPTTVPYRSLNVVAYPPIAAPTSPPVDLPTLNELLRRQDTNTICGYIGGDPDLPATCSAGSHCVLDADHGAVGCCPNGEETCTSGVFTDCVDPNSGPQTEVNPYVFTCTGSNVCYKNVFEGGNSQFGCGTASELGTVVSAGAGGAAAQVSLTSERISFTQSPSSLATPTELGSATRSDSSAGSSSTGTATDTTSGASSAASSSSLTTISIPSPTSSSDPTSSGSSSSSSGSTPANTAAPAADGDGGGGVNRTGAIVGGTISGVAVLAGLIAVGIYLWRRRAAGNTRRGPGPRPGDTQYVSPMSGAAFAPVGRGTSSPSAGSRGAASVRGKTIRHVTGGPDSRNTVFQTGGVGDYQYQYPGQNPAAWAGGAAAGAGMAAGGAAVYHGAYATPHDGGGEDEIPLRYGSPEIDDFSRGFHDALSRIGEEDEEDLESHVNGSGMPGTSNTGSGSGDLGESRPLWLQSRRMSRNQMWT
ncbi:hypothetical protein INS49_000590 [Diaporthe citri]|uniref:uncharacterized protein n=1 Tax=Diaporthe citri TaxID=83186 RepID=UPI001C8241C8|nr:uncharacterized protein INS49_000590 [Diaporthe citri]KAG6366413.1 hypothetical protein INS49_000590 [Diaporthe citri]